MRVVLLFAVIGLLSACAGPPETTDEMDVPAGAIPAGDDLYYVPLDYTDGDGCQPYRLYSPTRLVTQALYYRKADDSFTMNKREAACYDG